MKVVQTNFAKTYAFTYSWLKDLVFNCLISLRQSFKIFI